MCRVSWQTSQSVNQPPLSQSIPKSWSWCPGPCRSAGWRGGSWVTTCGDGHRPQLPGQTQPCSNSLFPEPEAGCWHTAGRRGMWVCWVLREVAGVHNLKNYSLFSWPLESAQTSQFAYFQGRQKLDSARCLWTGKASHLFWWFKQEVPVLETTILSVVDIYSEGLLRSFT